MVIFFGYQNIQNILGIFQNVMPGRADGSRGSAPSMPYLNEARPAAMPSEGLSGRRGAPTGAKVRVVIFKIFFVKFQHIRNILNIFDKNIQNIFVETFLLINPYKQYNQKIFRLSSGLMEYTD